MLSHELVHLQRRDYFFITWALVLKCVYWFNPLIYLAYRLFRLDQELACDQRVITLRSSKRTEIVWIDHTQNGIPAGNDV